MSMMREIQNRVMLLTARMPRRVYFTLKRLAMLLGMILAGIAAAAVVVLVIAGSMWLFGSPAPAIAVIVLGGVLTGCYLLAEMDVDEERRKNDRVLRELGRD